MQCIGGTYSYLNADLLFAENGGHPYNQGRKHLEHVHILKRQAHSAGAYSSVRDLIT